MGTRVAGGEGAPRPNKRVAGGRHKKCEDCKLKQPSFGLLAECAVVVRRRWCADCAKAHPGAESLKNARASSS